MKVLLVNKYFFLKGGAERVFFQEKECLKKEGVSVVDFSMEDRRNVSSQFSDHFVSNVDYYASGGFKKLARTSLKFIRSGEAMKQIGSLCEDEKPDIAHLHNIYHQLTPSVIPVLKRFGTKVVMTLHDGKLICPGYVMLNRNSICTRCSDGSFWRPFVINCQGNKWHGLLFSAEAYWHKLARSYEKVDLFLTPSSFLKKVISRRISPGKIRVLKNGVELDSYRPVWEDSGYALYLGRLSREKGLKTLCEAYEQVSGTVALKIVGTGPLEAELKKRYPKVRFMGFRTGNELKEIIGQSSFVVVPSEWYENCSMVVLEAMAMGKPVVGSRVGGIPEQVEDGKTGLLFEMGSVNDLARKMGLLTNDPSLRREMGKAARAKAEEEYSLKQHCVGLLEIYDGLLP